MGYVPTPNSASALHVYLGTNNVYVSVTGTTINPDPASGWGFLATDVGCPIMLIGGKYGGSPQTSFATFWTTIAAVNWDSDGVLTAAPPADVVGGQAIIFREIAYDEHAAAPHYILDGTLQMDASLSNRPTCNFAVHSADGTFIPEVGQAILVTHDVYGDQFGGSIDQVQITNYSTIAAVKIQCQCVSWEAILGRRLLRNTTLLYQTKTDTVQQPNAFTMWRIFFLTSVPANMVTVTLNGNPQTFGVYVDSSTPTTHAADWYWSPTQNLIWQDDWSGGVPAPDLIPTDVLLVTYTVPPANVMDYYNTDAGAIVTALIGLVENEGFTLDIAAGSPSIIQLSFSTGDTVDSALNSLAGYVSNGTDNYWYYITPRRVLHFETQGDPIANPAPWNLSTLDASDGNVLIQLSNTVTREKYANAALVDLGDSVSSLSETDSWPGDGSSREFNTARPMATAPTITVNGVAKTVGLLGDPLTGTGRQWYWELGSSTITQDVGEGILTETDMLSATYFPQVSITEQWKNSTAIAARKLVEGGSGECDTYVSMSGGAPQVSTVNQAEQLATYLAFMSEKVEGQTYRGGLIPGQSITVNVAQINAIGDYVVESVSLSVQNKLAVWSFSLIAGAVIGDWRTAVKSLGAGGGAGGGGAVSGGGGGGGGLANVWQESVTLIANTVISSPVSPPPVDSILTYTINQDSTGGWTITWSADYESNTPVDITPTANTRSVFRFSGDGSMWQFIPPFSSGVVIP